MQKSQTANTIESTKLENIALQAKKEENKLLVKLADTFNLSSSHLGIDTVCPIKEEEKSDKLSDYQSVVEELAKQAIELNPKTLKSLGENDLNKEEMFNQCMRLDGITKMDKNRTQEIHIRNHMKTKVVKLNSANTTMNMQFNTLSADKKKAHNATITNLDLNLKDSLNSVATPPSECLDQSLN